MVFVSCMASSFAVGDLDTCNMGDERTLGQNSHDSGGLDSCRVPCRGICGAFQCCRVSVEGYDIGNAEYFVSGCASFTRWGSYLNNEDVWRYRLADGH